MKIIKKLMMIAPLTLSLTPMVPISSCATNTKLKKSTCISKSVEEDTKDPIIIHEQIECLTTLEVLNKQELSGLAVGNKAKIQLQDYTDNTKNISLEFNSSNPDVATVEDGCVVAKSKGQTKIEIIANKKCPYHLISTSFYVNVFTEGCKVSFISNENGTVSVSNINAQTGSSLNEIIHNYDVLNCIPNEGYQFDNWVDENNNPINFDDPITCDKTFKATFKRLVFETDTWENIGKYARYGLNKLKEIYQVETFVGLTKKILINGHMHEVKVIGENHDTVSGTETKAPLTFQLTTLLSDASGDAIVTIWDDSDNFKYTRGISRGNLTFSGWKRSWETSAWDMLPNDLREVIRQVEKSTWEKDSNGENGHFEHYNDYLFALTCTEFGFTDEDEDYHTEGTPYEYWANHNNYNNKCFLDANGEYWNYWLASTHTSSEINAWYMAGNNVDEQPIFEKKAVSFGFCI